MFQAMTEGIKEESVGYLFNVEVQVDESQLPVEQEGTDAGSAFTTGLEEHTKGRLHYSAPGEAGDVEERDDVSGLSRRDRRAAKRAARRVR